MDREADRRARANDLSNQIIGAAIEVHRHLGPGLLESAYEACLAREMTLRGIPYERQVPLALDYKTEHVDCGYRLDFLVGGLVIVERKSVEKMERIYQAQLLTYLRLTNHWLGLLINFNVEVLTAGIKRMVNG